LLQVAPVCAGERGANLIKIAAPKRRRSVFSSAVAFAAEKTLLLRPRKSRVQTPWLRIGLELGRLPFFWPLAWPAEGQESDGRGEGQIICRSKMLLFLAHSFICPSQLLFGNGEQFSIGQEAARVPKRS